MTAKVKKVKRIKKESKIKKGLKSVATKLNKFKIIRIPASWVMGIGRYFKGAWTELRQVRWPNRKATWGLVFAVVAFTLFFVVLIVLLDAGFKMLFELILK